MDGIFAAEIQSQCIRIRFGCSIQRMETETTRTNAPPHRGLNILAYYTSVIASEYYVFKASDVPSHVDQSVELCDVAYCRSIA